MDSKQSTDNREKWKSPLDQYRGLIWTRLLWRRSGYLTPNQFARIVDGDSKFRQKWHNYFIGLRVPRVSAGRDPVEVAEALWPGTAQPFRSCVWPILKGQTIAGEALANEIARLGGDITFALLSGKGRHLLETGDQARGVRANAELEGPALEQHATPDEAGRALLLQAAEALRLSARSYTRVLRVARTVAGLAGAEQVGRVHVAEALSYRRRETLA